MKLYIVAVPWDSTMVDTVKVFTTKDKAEEYCDYRKKNATNYVPILSIEEFDTKTLKHDQNFFDD